MFHSGASGDATGGGGRGEIGGNGGCGRLAGDDIDSSGEDGASRYGGGNV